MASVLPNHQPQMSREQMLEILALPSAEFRAARENMSAADRAQLLRFWEGETKDAIRSSNEWVERHGLPLAKHRPF